jgi:hypothetical protein
LTLQASRLSIVITPDYVVNHLDEEAMPVQCITTPNTRFEVSAEHPDSIVEVRGVTAVNGGIKELRLLFQLSEHSGYEEAHRLSEILNGYRRMERLLVKIANDEPELSIRTLQEIGNTVVEVPDI